MSTGTTTLTDRKARAWLWPALFSLVAFAANSVFCRLALRDGAIDPASFTVVRLASGALFLLLLIRLRKPAVPQGGSWRGGLADSQAPAATMTPLKAGLGPKHTRSPRKVQGRRTLPW